MKNKVVEDFFRSAVHYCNIIENFDSNQVHNNLKALLVSLVDLYSKALYLPKVELENDEVADVDISVPQINFN
ncbi:hypothetical protein [Neobacillus massiliamazoniensis]|uniref:Uncharacterized protein n=1 Tax=Neobacillus massiliamazoniensis TaxID=1499688 RepID=A0A0U1NY39_9BACI|nr:hypothetical protein [Neobacillus massiliamazoniensis]CRK82940.1 hypothetical protein BN000_02895 [Neobacillus massiliamazoniensis]